ncbi:MAG: sulfatase-like hydrolase/transferase, partial [Planctomycetaceae bacterium]|nr:sulfatase-like hydrolase/transferase [Planctomycetaceae bacterium]
PLRPQEITVAEVLQQAGWATGHFGKWHLGTVRADSPLSPGQQGFDEWLSAPNFFELSPKLSHNGVPTQTTGEGSEVIVEAAVKFIRGAVEQKQPFLAVVWFGSPHNPHIATAEDRLAYTDQIPALQHYYGEITAMDRALGQLRTGLRELGVAENTLLWYTSDNGPQGPNDRRPGSAGGLRGRKGSLWEGGIRVPCLIEWPARVAKPRQSSIPAGTVDILPTVLEVAGLQAKQPDRPLDGTSLVPLLNGKMESRDKPLGFWVYPGRGIPMRSGEIVDALEEELADSSTPRTVDQLTPAERGEIPRTYSLDQFPGHAAWADGRFKLHQLPAGKGGDFRYLLYDLEADPAEQTNLVNREPERVRAMQQALRKWQVSVLQSANGEDYSQGRKPAGE